MYGYVVTRMRDRALLLFSFCLCTVPQSYARENRHTSVSSLPHLSSENVPGGESSTAVKVSSTGVLDGRVAWGGGSRVKEKPLRDVVKCFKRLIGNTEKFIGNINDEPRREHPA